MNMETTTNWSDLVRHASHGDHMVHLYQDPAFLAEAVGEYIASGLRGGEAGGQPQWNAFREVIGG